METQKPKFQTSQTDNKPKGEDFTGRKSKTIPDRTPSLREIIENSMRGIEYDVNMNKVPVFNGDEFLPDPKYMDHIDKVEFIKHVESNAKTAIAEHVESRKRPKKQQPIVVTVIPEEPEGMTE